LVAKSNVNLFGIYRLYTLMTSNVNNLALLFH